MTVSIERKKDYCAAKGLGKSDSAARGKLLFMCTLPKKCIGKLCYTVSMMRQIKHSKDHLQRQSAA